MKTYLNTCTALAAAVLLTTFGTACGGRDHGRDGEGGFGRQGKTEKAAPVTSGKRRGHRNAGPAEADRNEKAFSRTDGISLTENEQAAVTIETAPIAYGAIRSHLSALGKVMAHALASERIVLSADTDFGELLARSGAATPSVVLFRRDERKAETLVSVLLVNLDQIADDLASGGFVVLGQNRMRVRRLPLG